ncbi:MAG TPA: DUF5060 domain-containing protein [Bacteroidales bacterium]|nr:DUF5060 domain-containing protein [Bacteroidales bacterium]
MNTKIQSLLSAKVLLLLIFTFFHFGTTDAAELHPWEMVEITLKAEQQYSNYYTDVTCWVDLKGPGFEKRIYGFWDGDNLFRVRIVATEPGLWQWKSGSNQTSDKGLNDQTGSFEAKAWTKEELAENPNRHGFIRPTTNGHALQYADGTPFFMIGDTWLAGTTWRLPFRGAATSNNYIPGPGIGFEDAVIYRKNQGFNSVSMISCFPNWETDENPSTYANKDGIYVRNAWEKFDYLVENGSMTAKNMRDEYGNLPFVMSKEHKGVADFNQIIPAYFSSLDKKMEYLSEQGFVSLLETVRRDMCPTWKAYYNFNETYARFVQYLISRYGAYNIFFSGIHLDWIPKEYSLTADEFNEALTYHLNKYGPLPFGQPHTTLINNSTYLQFGHYKQCPWLTMHSVGNKPRDHRVSGAIDTLFNLVPAYPAINFEPYYTGWNHEINMPNGERPPANSERDNYFARAQMYGSVLSGALSGHVHGTAAYDITTTGEPEGMRPHIWEALKYESGNYMQHLKAFIFSEGGRFQNLQPAWRNIHPQKATNAPEKGLDGWSYMMITPEKDLALLYFENQAVVPEITGFTPNKSYSLAWFNTVNGSWSEKIILKSNKKGVIAIPSFPEGNKIAGHDWAAKIIKNK